MENIKKLAEVPHGSRVSYKGRIGTNQRNITKASECKVYFYDTKETLSISNESEVEVLESKGFKETLEIV
jgi:lactate dehydrogenase-like 2-hydroxyacid dehydrogenase